MIEIKPRKQIFTIAIVGRPNVGKSTMFNRLIGKRIAITSDYSGVTIDYISRETKINGKDSIIFDTPGIVETDPRYDKILQTIDSILSKSNVAILVIDGKIGLTEGDRYAARILQKYGVPTILAVNKCEAQENFASDGYELGLPVVEVSAQHGIGINDLISEISGLMYSDKVSENEHISHDNEAVSEIKNEENQVINVIVLGRPNAGKSTFINECVGFSRVSVSDKPGTTRDPVYVPFARNNREFNLIDTAGLQKQSNIRSELERQTCSKTYKALVFAHVAIVIIDSTREIEQQDFVILSKVINEGRALIVAASKWDLIQKKDSENVLRYFKNRIQKGLATACAVQVIPFSSSTGFGVNKIWSSVAKAYYNWNRSVSTPKLNSFLQNAISVHAPPRANGRQIKIKYISQIKSRPPSFSVCGNNVHLLTDEYKRYLINALADQFDLGGANIRLLLRRARNPYHKQDK
ncbi:ribosome biogenesis GTPase Der [Candidatus Hydrogenosomobacter endosymbioticus]|uniref:GTPase Der n=1 Tax=Candidatus Hydrogenosomobacter endosymbioticus TaxID=2558174 RepID=A0ABM7V8J2_9PROT|nr:ribosome biogenesis GTPase Der [Candidatus Hydrogenosomobacter endosymbioticus]BDB96091.1 GTPase Der [Candidatus Hydrogenosomobacter endosymbioticus]